MLIVTAVNVTEENGKRTLARKNGTADYIVEVAINHAPPIWSGPIINHKRAKGAAALLHRIANKMSVAEKLRTAPAVQRGLINRETPD